MRSHLLSSLVLLMRGPQIRYKVVEGSQSCHCCFDATVVDTTKPTMIGPQFESVCECFNEEEANLIAESLNRSQT